jgi:hypothetical protein
MVAAHILESYSTWKAQRHKTFSVAAVFIAGWRRDGLSCYLESLDVCSENISSNTEFAGLIYQKKLLS